ncbi:hypothetical protein BEH94_06170 [Candidatus Altiarchaeales archaeon WOR_SM1_SCG]|nr:hypothetical protein BEH94_06170 [Candidatus Altiarchaeales archaeon WOR_SM1_SCG]
MKNKYKISGSKKISKMNMVIGILISIIFLMFLPGVLGLSISSVDHSPKSPCYHPDTADNVIITWTTNENSTSKVYYRLTGGEGWPNEKSNDSNAMSHSVNLETLANGTYQYYVESCNATNCMNSSIKSFTVRNDYSVVVRSDVSSISGDPTETKSVKMWAENTGSESDTYTLTISNNNCNADITGAPQTVNAGPCGGTSSQKTLTVKIPIKNWGTPCYFDINAESVNGPTNTKRITININDAYNVDLNASVTEKSGNPGGNVTYTVRVTNTGSNSDSFNLTVSGASVPAYLSTITVTKAPGNYEDVTLTVTIPSNAASGAQYETTLMAKSNKNPSKIDSITFKTTASTGFGVTLTPKTQSGSADPGGSKIYTITIKNTGNAQDNFTLGVNNIGGAAGANLSKNNVTLNSGQQTTFTLTVTLPGSSAAGTIYRVNVTATSKSDTSVKDKAETITNTTSVAGGGITDFSAPDNASLQDVIKFYITFNNTGSVNVNVTPKVLIMKTGSVIKTVTGDVTLVQTQNTAVLEVEWTVTGLTKGSTYLLKPRVEFGANTIDANTGLWENIYILKPANISVEPQQIDLEISPNIPIDITLTVRNTGDKKLFDVKFYELSSPPYPFRISGFSINEFNVSPGESKSITMTVNSVNLGSHSEDLQILYYTDPSSPHTLKIRFNVVVSSGPHLIFDKFKYEHILQNGTPTQTEQLTVTNVGNENAYNITISATGDVLNLIPSIQQQPTINSNAGVTLDYDINIPATKAPGTYTGKFKIQYKNNNGTGYTKEADIEITVIVPGANLQVPNSLSATLRPDEFKTIAITPPIKNIGTENLIVNLNGNVDSTDITFTPNNFQLSSGEPKDVEVNIQAPSSTGTYTGTITVSAAGVSYDIPTTITVVSSCGDGHCDAGESCSCRDCEYASRCTSGGGRPTHRLEIKRIDDVTAKLGDTVKVKIEIENTGRRDEDDIELFIDDCPKKWICEKIKDIKINDGKSLTKYLEITVPESAVLKTYKLTAKVDNKDEDTESFKLIVGKQCSKDSDCKSDEYCENGVCRPKKDFKESCTRPDGSECESGICSGGVCIECESDNDCDSDEYCSLGECLDKKGVGEGCSEDYECASESCVNDKCIECESPDDCDSGEYCDDGICTNLKSLGESCESSDECETKKCKDERCGCMTDSDCVSGESCENGECKKKIIEKLSFEIIVIPENVTAGDSVVVMVLSNGEPVTGAVVSIRDKVYITDENGEVNFTANETGILNIIVSKSGYNELTSEIFVEEKEKEGFWTLWNIFIILFILLIVLVILIVILISRKKGGKDEKGEKSLQTLRGFREKFNYTSHEIKEKIKDMMASKKDKEAGEEGKIKEIKKVKKVAKHEIVKEAVKEEIKEKPKREIAEEEPELLSIDDITLPPIGEIVKEDEKEPEEEKAEAVKEEEKEPEEEKAEAVKEEEKKPIEEEKAEEVKEEEKKPMDEEKAEEVKEEEKKPMEEEKAEEVEEEEKKPMEEEKAEEVEEETPETGEKEKKEKPEKAEESTPWNDILKEK